MANELAGKVAIVTGGAKGLGAGTVELFVEEGAKVVIADLEDARGRELAERMGESAAYCRADISVRKDVQGLVDFAVSRFGGLHIMCNNAGVSDQSYGRLMDEEFAPFERVMNVNVLGVMLGTNIAARHMAANGGGSIINTSSIGGVVAGHGLSIYRASKAAVISFTKVASIELGEHLIRVNCICPGNIPTEMGTYSAPLEGMTQSAVERSRQAIAAIRMARQPLKRQGTPRDIAQAAVFLGSDRSQQITGQVLSIDGGATAGDPRSLIQEMLDARAAAASS